MTRGEIIFEELNHLVYNDVNQAGDTINVIDADDIPMIVRRLLERLSNCI